MSSFRETMERLHREYSGSLLFYSEMFRVAEHLLNGTTATPRAVITPTPVFEALTEQITTTFGIRPTQN